VPSVSGPMTVLVTRLQPATSVAGKCARSTFLSKSTLATRYKMRKSGEEYAVGSQGSLDSLNANIYLQATQ
jgi:hypothetical protein